MTVSPIHRDYPDLSIGPAAELFVQKNFFSSGAVGFAVSGLFCATPSTTRASAICEE
jgi:hypothetical protein